MTRHTTALLLGGAAAAAGLAFYALRSKPDPNPPILGPASTLPILIPQPTMPGMPPMNVPPIMTAPPIGMPPAAGGPTGRLADMKVQGIVLALLDSRFHPEPSVLDQYAVFVAGPSGDENPDTVDKLKTRAAAIRLVEHSQRVPARKPV